MDGLLLMALVIGATSWLCLSIKVALVIGEKARDTGFALGFYLITCFGMLALPFAVVIGVSG